MKRMTDQQVTVGVDTHKHIHVAVALSAELRRAVQAHVDRYAAQGRKRPNDR
jgi:hypothetical protein